MRSPLEATANTAREASGATRVECSAAARNRAKHYADSQLVVLKSDFKRAARFTVGCDQLMRLGDMLATWAVHDLSHIAQIAETMAKRYREDVGPWRRYLPVLDRAERASE